MRRTLLVGLALAAFACAGVPAHVSAATYYVSSDGDDAGDGRTPDAALASLSAAAARAQPGDRVLLRRGDVFRESVDVSVSNIVIDAYGPPEDDRPVVSGSARVAGWSPWKGGVYVAETDVQPGYLFVDARLMTIARYPNNGWLRTRTWSEEEVGEGAGRRRRGPRNTVVTCRELADHPRNAAGYWTGANIRWRHHSWWYETRPVLAYDESGVLTLGDRSFNDIGPFDWDQKGWGFYLDGKLEELDVPGEWCFQAEGGKVYLFPPNGEDPHDLLVEVSALASGLRLRDAVVRNVCFRHQKDVGLEIDGRCVVEDCLFEGIGCDATVSERRRGGGALRAAPGVRGARISRNEFRGNLNHSVEWWQDRDAPGTSVIERNLVLESGTVPGYGGSGSWHAVGILIGRGADVHVRHNRIEGTGYAGILLGSDGNVVENNVIRRAMSTLNDGAGIYTNCSRSTIRRNVILDTVGGMESSGSWANISHGIWLEFLGPYRESVVEANTCARSGAEGIFLSNNYECVVRGNVLYGNQRYQLLLTGRGAEDSEDATQEHLIENNVLCATSADQGLIYFDPRFDYGTLKGNYYCSPLTDEPFVSGVGWPGTSDVTRHTLASWQDACTWADADARAVHVQLGDDGAPPLVLLTNESEEPAVIPLDGPHVGLDGNPAADSVELAPYSSVVLIRTVGAG
jgi:parallel beta-helix repeat protein